LRDFLELFYQSFGVTVGIGIGCIVLALLVRIIWAL
jgi:hypothetical protein